MRKQLFEMAAFYSNEHSGTATLLLEDVVISVGTFNPKYSVVQQE